MHFVTLATVEIPHIEEDVKMNAMIAEQAENLKEQAICAILMGNGNSIRLVIRLVAAGLMCFW